jgi:hypothetical protein
LALDGVFVFSKVGLLGQLGEDFFHRSYSRFSFLQAILPANMHDGFLGAQRYRLRLAEG